MSGLGGIRPGDAVPASNPVHELPEEHEDHELEEGHEEPEFELTFSQRERLAKLIIKHKPWRAQFMSVVNEDDDLTLRRLFDSQKFRDYIYKEYRDYPQEEILRCVRDYVPEHEADEVLNDTGEGFGSIS